MADQLTTASPTSNDIVPNDIVPNDIVPNDTENTEVDEFDQLLLNAHQSNRYTSELRNKRIELPKVVGPQSGLASNTRSAFQLAENSKVVNSKINKRLVEIDILYKQSDPIIEPLWNNHVLNREQQWKKSEIIQNSTNNIRNILNSFNNLTSFIQLTEFTSSFYDTSKLSTSQTIDLHKEHRRLLASKQNGQWWRSQLSYLEDDPDAGYCPPYYDHIE